MTISKAVMRPSMLPAGDNLRGIVTLGNDRAMLINSAGNRELQSKAARRHMTLEVPLRFRSSCHRGHDEARSEDEYGAEGRAGQAGRA